VLRYGNSHRIVDIRCPAVLIEAGSTIRASPAWIPAKFAARLQGATAGDKPVLRCVDYNAGHGRIGATRRQGELNTADMYALRCGRGAIRRFIRGQERERSDETLARNLMLEAVAAVSAATARPPPNSPPFR
jgi:hypothetical protein